LDIVREVDNYGLNDWITNVARFKSGDPAFFDGWPVASGLTDAMLEYSIEISTHIRSDVLMGKANLLHSGNEMD
jgi:hypothetical protein